MTWLTNSSNGLDEGRSIFNHRIRAWMFTMCLIPVQCSWLRASVCRNHYKILLVCFFIGASWWELIIEDSRVLPLLVKICTDYVPASRGIRATRMFHHGTCYFKMVWYILLIRLTVAANSRSLLTVKKMYPKSNGNCITSGCRMNINLWNVTFGVERVLRWFSNSPL